MIPQSFIELDAIPLTTSGKINRRKLKKITVNNSSYYFPDINSLNKTEIKITEAWKTALGESDFSLDSPFFELGGDSMSLMQVFDILRQQYTEKLTSVDMFNYPTITACAF